MSSSLSTRIITDRLELYPIAGGIAAARRGNPTLKTTDEVSELVSEVLARPKKRGKNSSPTIDRISVGESELSQREISRAILSVDKQRQIKCYTRGNINGLQNIGAVYIE